jgi:hypothetical protein
MYGSDEWRGQGGYDWRDYHHLVQTLNISVRGGYMELFTYLAPGVLETYYLLPSCERWFVVLDEDALLAKQAVAAIKSMDENRGFVLVGTVTGRMSSSAPNLQNIRRSP